MARDDSPKIEIRDVWMGFADHRRSAETKGGAKALVQVLEKVNLSVNEGEFVCIVGPSGCGKSTLLNIIGGFLKASGGEVFIDGSPVRKPDPKRVFIFQENGVFPWMTVEDNIGFGLLDRPEEERRQTVSHYVEMVGLKGFEKSYPREISGGMKQRVEIARALAANPDVLYMDEPFGALDFLTRLRMRAELVEIWQRERKTVLFVTHDVEESVQLADRVVVMSRRPATIATVVDVNLPRPRDLDSPEYLSIRDEIFHAMGLDHSGASSIYKSAGEEAAPPPSSMVSVPFRSKKMDADVIVLGGGPAGAALGVHLGRAGVDHLILDKTHHPRAHVGESLSCAAMSHLDELGLLPSMRREQFLVKRGVSWTRWDGGAQTDIDYGELDERGHAYHIDRSKFDDLLLRYARDNGSHVLSGAEVERVDFDRQGFTRGVTVKVNEARFTLNARLVIDATGRQGLLGRQLRLLKNVAAFPQQAVHSWFSNMDRGGGATADFTHIHMLPDRQGWVWQVPITDEITSVGVVSQRREDIISAGDVDQYFRRVVALHPTLAERMDDVVRLREYRIDPNFSYSLERFAGNGWLAVGDAAFFTDQVFSSGICHALGSARLAADAVLKAFAADDLSQPAFAHYDEVMRRGAEIAGEVVRLFYERSPDIIGAVAASERRRDILRLCEGDSFGPGAASAMASLHALLEVPGAEWLTAGYALPSAEPGRL